MSRVGSGGLKATPGPATTPAQRSAHGGASPGAREPPEYIFFFQAEAGIRDYKGTGVQPCALPIYKLAAFLDRTAAARRPENPFESTAGIIPGDRGKEGGSWCRHPLSAVMRSQAISPAPLDGVMTAPVA